MPKSRGGRHGAASSTTTSTAHKAVFEKYAGQIAGFIVEPVAGNMGVVLPAHGYLAGLARTVRRSTASLLIFDEVMTGFRVAWGGAQVLYDVQPDLTCLGKVIGGGLPVGAYGGAAKADGTDQPRRPGLSGRHAQRQSAGDGGGIATLEILQRSRRVYETLERRSDMLEKGFAKAAADHGIPIAINRAGSMLTSFFVNDAGAAVTNFTQACDCDLARFKTFFHAMLNNGVYLPPSQFEPWFVSLAHSAEAIQQTIEAADKSFATISQL